MAKTSTQTAVVTSATNTAGSTARGRLDCSGADGGHVTFRITNGGTGPTVQCEARVLVSHASALPTAAAEGTADNDWKQVFALGGGTTASASTRGRFVFGPEVRHLEVEFTGNTGQSVTVEAIATTYVY
jgi:hypothetical protein